MEVCSEIEDSVRGQSLIPGDTSLLLIDMLSYFCFSEDEEINVCGIKKNHICFELSGTKRHLHLVKVILMEMN